MLKIGPLNIEIGCQLHTCPAKVHSPRDKSIISNWCTINYEEMKEDHQFLEQVTSRLFFFLPLFDSKVSTNSMSTIKHWQLTCHTHDLTHEIPARRCCRPGSTKQQSCFIYCSLYITVAPAWHCSTTWPTTDVYHCLAITG